MDTRIHNHEYVLYQWFLEILQQLNRSFRQSYSLSYPGSAYITTRLENFSKNGLILFAVRLYTIRKLKRIIARNNLRITTDTARQLWRVWEKLEGISRSNDITKIKYLIFPLPT